MKRPSRLSMIFRELACRVFGHPRMVQVSSQYVGKVRNGEFCPRCYTATATDFSGQYPVRRG